MLHILKGWLAAVVLLAASCGSPVHAMTIKGNLDGCIPYASTIENLVRYRDRNNKDTVWTWEQAEPYLKKSLEKARSIEGSWIQDDEDADYVMRNLRLAWYSFGEPGAVAAIYFKTCMRPAS